MTKNSYYNNTIITTTTARNRKKLGTSPQAIKSKHIGQVLHTTTMDDIIHIWYQELFFPKKNINGKGRCNEQINKGVSLE